MGYHAGEEVSLRQYTELDEDTGLRHTLKIGGRLLNSIHGVTDMQGAASALFFFRREVVSGFWRGGASCTAKNLVLLWCWRSLVRTARDRRLFMLALCATALFSGWVPSTTSIFGAQRGQIAQQLAGVPLPADRNWQTQLGSLWTFPADSLDTTGLGGGITFAFDPELCGKILPLFREDIAGIKVRV